MLVCLMAHDKPGALEVRKANRDAHLAYIDTTGCVSIAGPIKNESNEMCGSMIILDVPDMAAAQAWADGDPYAKAGLFQSATLNEWIKVIG